MVQCSQWRRYSKDIAVGGERAFLVPNVSVFSSLQKTYGLRSSIKNKK